MCSQGNQEYKFTMIKWYESINTFQGETSYGIWVSLQINTCHERKEWEEFDYNYSCCMLLICQSYG